MEKGRKDYSSRGPKKTKRKVIDQYILENGQEVAKVKIHLSDVSLL